MQALGVSDSELGEVTRLAYSLAELISFFTAGEDECRAWTIRSGTNAQDAAGEIHSDLARGFIRAEVVPYAALEEAGSVKAARDAGHYRLEQKPWDRTGVGRGAALQHRADHFAAVFVFPSGPGVV